VANSRSVLVTVTACVCAIVFAVPLIERFRALLYYGHLEDAAGLAWFAFSLAASVGLLLRKPWARRSLMGALALSAIGWTANTLRHRGHVVAYVVTTEPVRVGDPFPGNTPVVGPFSLRTLGIIETVAVVLFAASVISVLSTRRARADFEPPADTAA
jgi:hypothetical protein